jgi:hypothetical protein
MTIELGLTKELCNTQYAALAALCAHYQQNQVLAPLAEVQIQHRKRDFSPSDKLTQVFLSVLAGCRTLSEVNTYLTPESDMAAIWGWDRFADQSSLSRTLDALTLKHLQPLRQATTQVWRTHSQIPNRNWRGYLWVDFDLSSLPCGPQAEKSQKGYGSGKKTSPDASWRAPAW